MDKAPEQESDWANAIDFSISNNAERLCSSHGQFVATTNPARESGSVCAYMTDVVPSAANPDTSLIVRVGRNLPCPAQIGFVCCSKNRNISHLKPNFNPVPPG